ncbi:MAG TPA: hypothetical protein VE826_15020 [Dongiaceae bacterium]|nr:hypothetical protein [Dongiaceae bacterium]
MADTVAPILAVIFFVGLPVSGWILRIYLKHQERMEMLRRGIVPPPEFNDKRMYRAWRRAGSPWPPPGMAARTPFVQPPPQPQPQPWSSPEDDPQRALYKGIRVALVGLALTMGLGIAFGGYSGNPAILGGLIPMFVGIAQIIVAILSGAQLPGVMPVQTFIPPPQPPPPGTGTGTPGPGSTYGSSTPPPWADQPGRPRFEELSKPVPPPDLR